MTRVFLTCHPSAEEKVARQELSALRGELAVYAEALAKVAGVISVDRQV